MNFFNLLGTVGKNLFGNQKPQGIGVGDAGTAWGGGFDSMMSGQDPYTSQPSAQQSYGQEEDPFRAEALYELMSRRAPAMNPYSQGQQAQAMPIQTLMSMAAAQNQPKQIQMRAPQGALAQYMRSMMV